MAYGDIGAIVDTLEFCVTNAARCFIIHVTGEIFAIAYVDADSHGMVATVGINAAGDIEPTIIDSLEFDTTTCGYPTIVHVSGSIYAIAYRGPDNDGWVCTVDIAANGVIENAVVDTLEFDTSPCYDPNLIHHTGTTFAVVYRNAANHGTLTTFAIDAAGNIGAAPIDTGTFVASHGNEPKIVNVFGNIFATVYRTGAFAGGLCTSAIAADGTITTINIETVAFVPGFVGDPDICNAIGNIYAIAYRGVDNDGFLATIDISDAGDIGAATIDTLEFDTDNCAWSSIIPINAGMCAIASQSTGNLGLLTTVQVDAAGEITDTILDNQTFDAADGINPKLIVVDDDTFVIAYSGAGSDGFVTTITIERPSLGQTRHLTLMGVG